MNKEVIEISDDDSCSVPISRLAPVPKAIPLIGLETQEISSRNRNVDEEAVDEENINCPGVTPVYVEIEAHVVNEEPYLISSAESSSEDDEDEYPAIKKRICMNSVVINNKAYYVNDNLPRKTNKPGPLSKTRYISKCEKGKQSTNSDDERSADDNDNSKDGDFKNYFQENSEDDFENDYSEDEESIVDLITDSENDNKSDDDQSESVSCKMELDHKEKYCINDSAYSPSQKNSGKRVNLTTLSYSSLNQKDSSDVKLPATIENDPDAICSSLLPENEDRMSDVVISLPNPTLNQNDFPYDKILSSEKKESNDAYSGTSKENMEIMSDVDTTLPLSPINQNNYSCSEILSTGKKESNDSCSSILPEINNRISDVDNKSSPNSTIDKKDVTCGEVFSTKKKDSDDTGLNNFPENVDKLFNVPTISSKSIINQCNSPSDEIFSTEKKYSNDASSNDSYCTLPENVEKVTVVGSPNSKINSNDSSSSEKKDSIDADLLNPY